MTVQATNRSVIGVAKEATKGTGVVPTDYIVVRKFDPFDKLDLYDDTGWRGSATDEYGVVAGKTWGEIDTGGDVFADTIGWLLASILGDLTTTGASAPFTHAFSLLNSGQPQSLSATDSDGMVPRRYAGVQVSELSFKYDAGGLFTYDAKAVSFASTIVSAPTASFSGVTPAPSWALAASIGGSAVGIVQSGEFNLKRVATPIMTVDGTQAPHAIFVGPLAVDGKLSLLLEDETQLLNYLNNSQPALDLNYTAGAGAAAVQVKLHASKAAFTAAKRNRGKEYLVLDVDFKAIANATDAGASGGLSPCKITLQNAKAASIYI